MPDEPGPARNNHRHRGKRRVRRESELAKSIQRTLIPASGQLPPEFGRIDFALASVLAAHRGSDIVETFVTDAGRPGFVMAEAIGDSVSACLSMMKFRAIFQPCVAAAMEPLDIMNRGMEHCRDEKVFRNQFLSVIIGFFDVEAKRLDYVNAGFYPPFLKRAGGTFEQLRETTGVVFTTAHPVEFRQESITFEPGDTFFACSNGIFSYCDSEGQCFTKKMLMSTLEASQAASARGLIDEVAACIRGFSGELPPDDDVIMTAFRMNP